MTNKIIKDWASETTSSIDYSETPISNAIEEWSREFLEDAQKNGYHYTFIDDYTRLMTFLEYSETENFYHYLYDYVCPQYTNIGRVEFEQRKAKLLESIAKNRNNTTDDNIRAAGFYKQPKKPPKQKQKKPVKPFHPKMKSVRC